MKLRHAAALALAGWYLIMPPTGRTLRVGLAAPLSQWRTVGTFNSADDCESGKRKGLPLLEKRIKEKAGKAGVAAHDSDVQVLAGLSLRCIASDDPRLKGK
jgi:hypothetical protein